MIALIVDHGLRPCSAEQARLTMERLAARKIPCRLLKPLIHCVIYTIIPLRYEFIIDIILFEFDLIRFNNIDCIIS